MKKKKFHISIVATLIIFNIIVFLSFAQILNTLCYNKSIVSFFTEEYNELTKTIYQISGDFINADNFDSYLENKNQEEYDLMQKKLNEICNTQDISTIVLLKPSKDYKSYRVILDVVNTDTGYSAWEKGEVRDTSTNAAYDEYYKEIMNGEKNEIFVNRYDNLTDSVPHINSLFPIKDSDNNIVGIMTIQRKTEKLSNKVSIIRKQVHLISGILVIIVVLITFIFVKRKIVKPLKNINEEANRFSKENTLSKDGVYKGSISEIIDNHDCVINLEKDVIDYINKVSVIAKNNERITTELNVGTTIQKGFVPTLTPEIEAKKEFKLFANMVPSKEVGGDFYDYFLIDDDNLGIVIGDVSGKGVPAALLMMTAKTLIKENAFYKNSPAKTLELTNNRICEAQKDYMFITLWHGILNLKTGVLKFANAGHGDAIISKNGKNFTEYGSTHDIPLGVSKDYKYTDNEIKLEKNDKLFICTDGVFEAINENKEQFGFKNMIDSLNKNIKETPKKVITNLYNDIENFTNGIEQFDDITMLYLDYCKNDVINISSKYKADYSELNNIYETFIPIIAKKTSKEISNLYYTVFDEIISNIIKYGYDDNIEDSLIEIELNIDPKNQNIALTIKDNGKQFDPLSNEDPDVQLALEERNIGGLGIHIVKNIMDDVKYKYEDNKNILYLEKKYIDNGK